MVRIGGWLVFGAAALWPVVAAGWYCAEQGGGPADGWWLSSRQWGLIWKSVWLAGTGTMACLMVALPAGLAMADGRRQRGWLVAMAAGVLLSPPMVYAFGWAELLPKWWCHEARCILVWALWGWPIAAFLIGAGWSRVGRSAFEAALLETSRGRAFWHIGLPALRRHIVGAGLLLFVLFFGDYGVPHACGLIVYATELLLYASSSPRLVDTLWPALPGIVLIGALLLAAYRVIGSMERGATDVRERWDARWSGAAAGAVILVAAAPMIALTARFGSWEAIAETVRVYGSDILWTLAAAGAAGVLSVWMGLAVAAGRRGSVTLMALSVVLGACPGAAVGVALAAAYNHAATGWVYDGAGILVLCLVARFGWIGILAGMVVARGMGRQLVEQAMVDGATRGGAVVRMAVGAHWPMLLAAGAAVAALGVAELAASTVVRPVTFAPVAQVVIEKFHRFEYGVMFALCALLVICVVPALVVVRRGSSMENLE